MSPFIIDYRRCAGETRLCELGITHRLGRGKPARGACLPRGDHRLSWAPPYARVWSREAATTDSNPCFTDRLIVTERPRSGRHMPITAVESVLELDRPHGASASPTATHRAAGTSVPPPTFCVRGADDTRPDMTVNPHSGFRHHPRRNLSLCPTRPRPPRFAPMQGELAHDDVHESAICQQSRDDRRPQADARRNLPACPKLHDRAHQSAMTRHGERGAIDGADVDGPQVKRPTPTRNCDARHAMPTWTVALTAAIRSLLKTTFESALDDLGYELIAQTLIRVENGEGAWRSDHRVEAGRATHDHNTRLCSYGSTAYEWECPERCPTAIITPSIGEALGDAVDDYRPLTRLRSPVQASSLTRATARCRHHAEGIFMLEAL